jgi:hypothetical protein
MATEIVEIRRREQMDGQRKLVFWEAVKLEGAAAEPVASSTPLAVPTVSPLARGHQPQGLPTVSQFEHESKLRAAHKKLVARLQAEGWEPAGRDEDGRVITMSREGG